MFDFLKKLVASKNRDLTVVVMDEEEPESSSSYRLRPNNLLSLFYGVLAGVLVFSLLLIMFTPLGALVYNKEDEALRKQVIEVSQRMEALQDSLLARDIQLSQIQEVLAEGRDTTFEIGRFFNDGITLDETSNYREQQLTNAVNPVEMVSKNEIIFSGILKDLPGFPAPYPVEGTVTRGFSQATGHYGMDIATKDQTLFRVIADGSVISRDWTVSYGYVIQVQHRDGLVSIYKHAVSLRKEIGDIVLKGDILGTVGNTGILSSGPHLHLEIWKNGVPQNPEVFLIKS